MPPEAGLDEVDKAYRASGRAAGLALKYGDVLGEEIAGFFVYQVARDDTARGLRSSRSLKFH